MHQSQRPHATDSTKTVLAMVVAMVFVLACLAKIVDSAPIRETLAFVGLVPGAGSPAALVAASTIAGLELFVAAMLLTTKTRRSGSIAAAALLLPFSVVLVILAVKPDSPSCGCMPTWIVDGAGTRQAVAGLVRNAGLLGVCFLLLMPNRPVRVRGAIPPVANSLSRPGFTIVELLVVIAILTVALAISLPALAAARERGREAVSLAMMQQTFISLSSYSNDNRGVAPFLATPEQPWVPIRVNGHTPKDAEYFAQRHYFVNLLYPDYAPDWRVFANDAHSLPPEFIFSRIWLAQGAFALPDYWVGEFPPDNLRLYRPTPLDRITYPSAKGLLLDTSAGRYAHTQRHAAPLHVMLVGLADGSSSARRFEPEMLTNTVSRPYGSAPWPILATVRGFEGRDFD
ncbi:MAG: type II secretion system protein [Phycisphaeraceae bacterium]|nr:type II secretion system protein [Phycisphaeraceae bacterium]